LIALEFVGGPWDGLQQHSTGPEPESWLMVSYKEGPNPRSVLYRLWRHDQGKFLYRYEPQRASA